LSQGTYPHYFGAPPAMLTASLVSYRLPMHVDAVLRKQSLLSLVVTSRNSATAAWMKHLKEMI
jgi:hypothetical protein